MSAVISSGIFTKLLYVPEATFDTLPATPTMIDIPFVDCSLSPDITKVTDNIIQGDTMHRYVVPTTQKVTGTISGEVSHTQMDWLLEGVFYSTFTSNVLSVGSTQSSYSLEIGATDISQYTLYSGAVVDKLALTFAPAGLVTYKADLVGASFSMGTVTNANTTTAAPHFAPLTTVNATIKANGANVGWITGATITFDRKTTVNYALGNATPRSMSTSFFNASGTLDLFFEDEIAFGYFKDNTASSLDWTLTDGTNTYELLLPNMYYETFSVNVTSAGPIKVKSNFSAVYDPTTATVAKVTRSS